MATAPVGTALGFNPQATQNDSLSPRLETAPDLLFHLGWCIAVSATPEVARITLPYSAPAGPGLSTNLIRIANDGNSAFLGAYKDLLRISTSSDDLCQDGGLLDQLGEALVHGATKSSKNLIFKWVQDCVDSCHESGSRTSLNFDSWRVTVNAVQEAVTDANYANEINLESTKYAQRLAKGKYEENRHDISFAMEQVAYAVQKTEDDQAVHERRVNNHEETVAEQMKEYLHNPFLAALKRPFKYMSGPTATQEASKLRMDAQKQLHQAFEELSRREKEEMKLRLHAQRIQAEIAECKYTEMKLTSIGANIREMCGLLAALGNDVQMLLRSFANISNEITSIMTIRKQLERPGGISLGIIKINPFKKKETFQQAPKKDEAFMNRIFLRRILQMKRICLGIHITANLYACIINEVINYGFAEAIRASYDNLGETLPNRIFEQRKLMMNRWYKNAKLICAAKNREAVRLLNTRMQTMGQNQFAMA